MLRQVCIKGTGAAAVWVSGKSRVAIKEQAAADEAYHHYGVEPVQPHQGDDSHRHHRPNRPGRLSTDHEKRHAQPFSSAGHAGYHHGCGHMKQGYADAGKHHQHQECCVCGCHTDQAHGNSGQRRCENQEPPHADAVCKGPDPRVDQGGQLHYRREQARLRQCHGEFFDEQRQQRCQKAGIDIVDEVADGNGDDARQVEPAEGQRCCGCA